MYSPSVKILGAVAKSLGAVAKSLRDVAKSPCAVAKSLRDVAKSLCAVAKSLKAKESYAFAGRNSLSGVGGILSDVVGLLLFYNLYFLC